MGRSIADRAVAVLERAGQPLPVWDIKRLLDREDRKATTVSGPLVRLDSLGVSLANDPRTCWAGPSSYGLYRHGLLPGVRTIGDTAIVHLHASPRVISVEELYFVLRLLGYRFQQTSLNLALYRHPDAALFRIPTLTDDGQWTGHPERRAIAAAHALRLRRGKQFDAIIAEATARVSSALEERERRAGQG